MENLRILGEAINFVAANAWSLIAVWVIYLYKNEFRSILSRMEMGEFAGVKLSILKATSEAEHATKEAYAAIGELRELTLAVAQPINDMLAVSGETWGTLSPSEKLTHSRRIQDLLRKLGVDEAEIQRSIGPYESHWTANHVRVLIAKLADANAGRAASFDHLHAVDWSRRYFDDFVAKNALVVTPEVEEAVRDLEHFLKTKTLNRSSREV